jgi:hypothetical protein
MRWLLLVLTLLLTFARPAEAQQWTQAPEVVEGTELPPVPPDWITVPGTFLRVHGPEELTGVLLRVARHGSSALPELATRLEVPIGDTVHIYVAPDDATFRSIQPGLPPTWADATAWPKLGAVFLRAPEARPGTEEPLEQVLDHELVHVLLGRAFAPRTPPAWLQEGVAQVLADQLGPDEAQTLARGSLTGLVSLESLEHGFPSDPRRARLAYAESADFVAYLMEHHGEGVVRELVRQGAKGGSMRQVVFGATGRFLDDVEADWRAPYDTAPVQFAALAGGEWLWLVGAAALTMAWVRRRRDFRRRLAEMEAEEALVDALVAAYRPR